MKKTACLVSLLFGLFAVSTGCDDSGASVIQDEYRKVVLLKTSGVIDLTVYNTGSDTDYNVTVLRSGMSPELPVDASVSTMNAAEFQTYCDDRGLNLTAIPTDCYALPQVGALNFGADERYKSVVLTLHTSTINELPASETEYVIPLILTSNNATVNGEQDVLLIRPHVVVPAVTFAETGLVTQYVGAGQTTINVPLRLQIENNWNFTCTVGVDESLAGDNPLLSGGYTLENGGVVTFTEGNREATLKVTVDRADAGLGSDMRTYVLPLVMKEVSLPTFGMDSQSHIMGVTAKAKYPLTAAMLYTNAQEASEGPLPNVLDGSVATYFHSDWHNRVPDAHYVQVTLPEPETKFMFSYTNRSTNGTDALAIFDVMVSSNGTDYTQLRHYDKAVDTLPLGAAGVFNSEELTSETPFTSVRFVCRNSNSNRKFFVWSEFSLYTIQ